MKWFYLIFKLYLFAIIRNENVNKNESIALFDNVKVVVEVKNTKKQAPIKDTVAYNVVSLWNRSGFLLHNISLRILPNVADIVAKIAIIIIGKFNT